jgi:transcription initiation factor TFIIIB Brf1 subunit/transcription initiation factor TFIIB
MAIAALLIGCKYEEIYPPDCKDMIKVSGEGTITKKDVLVFESEILRTLEFEMQPHTAHRFLERLCKLTNAEDNVFHYSMFILEMCLLDAKMVTITPSTMASAALWLAYKTVRNFSPWNAVMVKNTGLKEEDLKHTVKEILKVFELLKKQDLDISVIKKYSKPKYGEVAKLKMGKLQ